MALAASAPPALRRCAVAGLWYSCEGRCESAHAPGFEFRPAPPPPPGSSAWRRPCSGKRARGGDAGLVVACTRVGPLGAQELSQAVRRLGQRFALDKGSRWTRVCVFARDGAVVVVWHLRRAAAGEALRVDDLVEDEVPCARERGGVLVAGQRRGRGVDSSSPSCARALRRAPTTPLASVRSRPRSRPSQSPFCLLPPRRSRAEPEATGVEETWPALVVEGL